ncbi:hypothetical protein L208DRAFT_614647 [Tricholoma matsutake]|nr:hypothetical protein L208DRAFT_614647 [Tricholoma matsutake 945]
MGIFIYFKKVPKFCGYRMDIECISRAFSWILSRRLWDGIGHVFRTSMLLVNVGNCCETKCAMFTVVTAILSCTGIAKVRI